MPRPSQHRSFLPLAAALVLAAGVAAGPLCGPVDEPPGEWRLCCEGGENEGGSCPEDACGPEDAEQELEAE